MSLPSGERAFLWGLENLEARRIALGDYDSFVELNSVCKETGLNAEQGLKLAEELAKKRLLLLDRSTGTDIVRSKAAHSIKALYHTTMRGRLQRQVRNVSDLKYIRFIKQVPRPTLPLSDQKVKDSITGCLLANQRLEKDVTEAGLQAVASLYPTISAFQLSASQKILELLGKAEGSQSLVVVAETGAGKTLAYQLPLLLWIISKKIRRYIERKSRGMSDFAVNCSALLLFPRNVLAKDQFDGLVDLSARINDEIGGMKLPTDLTTFLQIRTERDFGSVGLEDRTRIYSSFPDVIVTNADTLKRRIMNPLCSSLYQRGIDLVLYDEVHLYYGLFGANVASLNVRLQNVLPYAPIFVGMSATIANPQKHCLKLFGLKDLPHVITDREDVLADYSLEHHVMIKPKAGRSALGVCIDTTSCLLHNRRGDFMRAHLEESSELRPKSLCFVDSLDIAGRWESDLRNYENFMHPFPAITRPRDGYAVHYAPWALLDATQAETCNDCKSSRDVVAAVCDQYQAGQCWWFSQDSASHIRWRQRPNGFFTPNDNIRARRLTSQEVDLSELKDIYSLFVSQDPNLQNLPIDALIATSVLEVGVDFRMIKEVVMYGEIRSPISYKQKAGRGAREGNTDDGLFVMTVIPPSPLANFYYRHFYRLVYPSLVPLPLEPRNPDIIRSHSFCAVFDYLAMMRFDVFNIIRSNQEPQQVENDFDRAILFIRKEKGTIKDFVVAYIQRLGENKSKAEELAQESIAKALEVLEALSAEHSIGTSKKKLVTWVFEAFREQDTMARLEEDFEENFEKLAIQMRTIVDARESIGQSKREIINALSVLGEQYKEDIDKIKKKLSTLEATL
jgi:hypothetical protein